MRGTFDVRPDRPRDAGAERGYAMAGLLVAIAVLGVLTSVALPSWRTFAKREKEAELLFRGGQYVRAIDLYQRRYPGAYPTDLDVLVEERFLRRRYPDPMTGEPFRVMTQGSAATALGEAAGDAAEDLAAGNDDDRRPDGGRLSDRRGRSAFGGAGADRGRISAGSGRGASTFGSGRGRSASGSTGSGRGRSAFGSTGRGRPTESGPGSTFSRDAGGTEDELGAIVGVVSRSSEPSLREYNGATRYDQWIFVHAPGAAVPGAAGATAAGGGTGAGPAGRAGRAQRPAGHTGDRTGRSRGFDRMRGR